MTHTRFATVVASLVVLLSAATLAEAAGRAKARWPTLAPSMTIDEDGFVYVESAAEEAPSESPSDLPEPPPMPDDLKAKPQQTERAPESGAAKSGLPERVYDPAYDAIDLSGGCCASSRCCTPCTIDCRSCRRGLEFGGWIDHGISGVANNPADRYNGPVTFNDRHGEYQMNQLWFYAQREVDTSRRGWDVGGRVDFVYGSDARFTQAADGLEANWNQTEPFYQAALPQFYLDVGVGDWVVRMGHFFTILGYEVVPAPDNFFYSHAYTMQYGEPFTHTGILFSRDIGPNWTFSAGLHRGNDQFDDTDGLDAMNYLGGFSWTNCRRNLSVAFALSATEQGPCVNQLIYSLVGTWDVTDRLTYVIQHDQGDTFDPALGRRAQWYGINQYFLYELNKRWAAGLRVEWFRDDDGVRVAGLGAGNQNQGLPPNPPAFAGDFYEITLGLNYNLRDNCVIRPEVRWDWFDSQLPNPPGNRPYDAGDRNSQFLIGFDMIYMF